MGASAIIALTSLGIATMFSISGVVAWFHLYMAKFKDRVRDEISLGLSREASERTKDIEALAGSIRSINELSQSVALMGKSLEHLTEKLSGNQEFISEVRKTVNIIDKRLNDLTIDVVKQTTRRRSAPRKKTTVTPEV